MHEEKLFRFFLSEEGSITLKCIFKGWSLLSWPKTTSKAAAKIRQSRADRNQHQKLQKNECIILVGSYPKHVSQGSKWKLRRNSLVRVVNNQHEVGVLLHYQCLLSGILWRDQWLLGSFEDRDRTGQGRQRNAEIITAILGLKNIKYHLERSVLISAEARNRTSCCCPSLTSGLTSCTNAKVKLI